MHWCRTDSLILGVLIAVVPIAIALRRVPIVGPWLVEGGFGLALACSFW